MARYPGRPMQQTVGPINPIRSLFNPKGRFERPSADTRDLLRRDYSTCAFCSEIHDGHDYLDGQSICRDCLGEKQRGPDRRLCRARGFHQTWSSRSRGGVEVAEDGTTATFAIEAHCRCGRSAEFRLTSVPAESGGYPIPRPPKYWRGEYRAPEIVAADEGDRLTEDAKGQT